jgi:Leucine-rich repeat (LRR) protein
MVKSQTSQTLEWLKIVHSKNLTYDAIVCLGELPKLRYLDVSGNTIDRQKVIKLMENVLRRVESLCT